MIQEIVNGFSWTVVKFHIAHIIIISPKRLIRFGKVTIFLLNYNIMDHNLGIINKKERKGKRQTPPISVNDKGKRSGIVLRLRLFR